MKTPALIITRDQRGEIALVTGRRAGECVEAVCGPRRPHGGAYPVHPRHVPAITAVAERLGGGVAIEDVGR